jgi:hypothetical protein
MWGISWLCVTSGFRRDIDEICALLGCYAALSGSSVQTFRYKLSVPSSTVKKSKKTSWGNVSFSRIILLRGVGNSRHCSEFTGFVSREAVRQTVAFSAVGLDTSLWDLLVTSCRMWSAKTGPSSFLCDFNVTLYKEWSDRKQSGKTEYCTAHYVLSCADLRTMSPFHVGCTNSTQKWPWDRDLTRIP